MILTVGLLPSALKKLYYRLQGAKIARGVRLGMGSIILSEDIEIDRDASIDPFSVIAARRVTIGKRVKIGAMCFLHAGEIRISNDATLYEQVMCGGPETPRSTLSIGNRVSIFQFTYQCHRKSNDRG
jgi:UDP-3-O-[3-hydroxymyristoyl] glucosamine N-acyltransferase